MFVPCASHGFQLVKDVVELPYYSFNSRKNAIYFEAFKSAIL